MIIKKMNNKLKPDQYRQKLTWPSSCRSSIAPQTNVYDFIFLNKHRSAITRMRVYKLLSFARIL